MFDKNFDDKLDLRELMTGLAAAVHPPVAVPEAHTPAEVRGYFLVFVQLLEKYGTLIEINTALIEKVSPCIGSRDWRRQ
eukprot:SAG31_NODE_59_length_29571_cov_20.443506_5_plen_79_part_00